jgi:ligand-binding sensor domain-containing protein/serine phosphatase RsbU (regulator of sigma subunit)
MGLKITFRYCFIFIFLFAAPFLHAQDYKFAHIGVEQGLSQSVVNCILQDSKGFMWFGTQEGLNRYDGYNFKVFKRDPQNPNSIAGNFIYTLFEDKNGIIWIGTNGNGLDAYNPALETFTHYANNPENGKSISDNAVRVIYQDHKNRLWFGTDRGLNLFDEKTKTFTRFIHNNNDEHSLSGDQVYSIIEDNQKNLWVSTYENGLNLFDESKRQFLNYQTTQEYANAFYPKSFSSDPESVEQMRQVRVIKLLPDGNFILGTDGAGLEVFNPSTRRFIGAYYPSADSTSLLNDKRIFDIKTDSNGQIWLATYKGGVNVLSSDFKTSQYYVANDKDPFAIKSNSIRCIYSDAQGNIWLGSNGFGIDVYFKQTSLITHIRKSERPEVGDNTLRSNAVFSILEDSEGFLWIGTLGGGVSQYNPKTGNYIHHPELSTATNNSVLSLFEDRRGRIWVGTYGEGINVWDKKTKTIKNIQTTYTRGDGTILCITEEPATGAIWFGTYGGGIFRVDPQTDSITRLSSDDGLSTEIIFSVYFDQTGTMWMGGKGGGLMKRDPRTERITVYKNDPKKTSLSNNIISFITSDKKGDMWIGTTNGLNRLNPKSETFWVYYEKDGIASDNIYAALQDNQGLIWLSHNKGISSFNPNAEGLVHFNNYGTPEGVQPGEFNQGAWFKSRSNTLFFGGQNGLNIIDPKSIVRSQNKSLVQIISYQRFGNEVKLDSTISSKRFIEVSWKENDFQFEFFSTNLIAPSKNMFQYYLEGFNTSWSVPSTNHFATYTNLSGGNYVFHVRTIGADGRPASEETVLYIRIRPPFWRTYWFYALCGILTAVSIFVFIRLRTSAIQKENKILEARVEERTHELAQKNKDITSSIQYAQRIQVAMLPENNHIFRHLYDAFILYKPKDIVSGDFYWFSEKNGRKIIAVADCTGHGVPGALMSMIGHNLLNQIVQEKNIIEPSAILQLLNEGVRAALKQDQHLDQDQDTADGMDMAICSIDIISGDVLFAGALRPLVIARKDSIEKIECDRFTIGGSQDNRERIYTAHRVKLNRGDRMFMFTDGFADQFGGAEGKKFMVKRLLETLQTLPGESMQEQGIALDKTFTDWCGTHHQVDDVLVVGIRL